MEEMKGDRPHTILFGTLAAAVFDTLPVTGVLFTARGKEPPFFWLFQSQDSL